MTRYWFTLRAAGYWYAGWCFGDAPEAAAADALNQARRWHPPSVAELKCHLQEVPTYEAQAAGAPTTYHTVQL